MSTVQRRLLLFLIIQMLFSGWLMAQPDQTDLTAINRDRITLNSNGMLVLGSWAISNIIIGGIGMARTGGTTRYFHQMNAAWNSVNLAVAGFGYYGLQKQSASLSLSETVAEFQNFEKILLFNAGLDVGYMALGAFLWERGLRKESDRLTGYGQSLILQGGFLFTFDLVLYFMNRSQSSRLLELLEQVQFNGTSVALHIPF